MGLIVILENAPFVLTIRTLDNFLTLLACNSKVMQNGTQEKKLWAHLKTTLASWS